MLQLLLERGQSYADLASVLGIEEGEVRGRARAALTELAGEDPDRNVGLTDYLLGQADPIGRADAVRHLRDAPEDLRLVQELMPKLRLIAPEAELPRLPGEPRAPRARPSLARVPRPGWGIRERLPGRRRRAEPAEGAEEAAEPREPLSPQQTRLMVGLASAAVLLVAIVLAVTGAFSGSGSGGGSTVAASGTSTTAASFCGETSAQVTLTGHKASGSATFAEASGSQPFVELNLSNLPPAPTGKAYIAWLLVDAKSGHPISPVSVSSNGTAQARIPLQDFQIPIAQQSQFIDVSLSDAAALQGELNNALKNQTPIVAYQGQSVLRGDNPCKGSG
jgi:hypothetical protein